MTTALQEYNALRSRVAKLPAWIVRFDGREIVEQLPRAQAQRLLRAGKARRATVDEEFAAEGL
jgi:hypothetical protein